MAEHDVLAMMSVWENCSYALLDAVARGMGVVATPVGGNPEILPSRSLVGADDTAAVAETLADQGLNLDERPALNDWPSVARDVRSHRCDLRRSWRRMSSKSTPWKLPDKTSSAPTRRTVRSG